MPSRQSCAYPFRYGLPTTCSDVIIDSECADRRASAPAPSGCAARRHEGSLSEGSNIKTVYLVHTRDHILTLRCPQAEPQNQQS